MTYFQASGGGTLPPGGALPAPGSEPPPEGPRAASAPAGSPAAPGSGSPAAEGPRRSGPGGRFEPLLGRSRDRRPGAPEEEQYDLAGLFGDVDDGDPEAQEPRWERAEPAEIDLTRLERIRRAPARSEPEYRESGPAGSVPPEGARPEPASPEPPRSGSGRGVPPGFPVELPEPSARREQMLLLVVRWLIVLFATVLGALGGLTYSALQSNTYTAKAAVIVAPVAGSSSSQTAPVPFAQAYARVATDPAVLQPALTKADLSMSVDEASKNVRVSVSPDAPLISVEADSSAAGDAAALANAVADGIATYGTAHAKDTGFRVTVFTPAATPTSSATPNRLIDVLAGGVLGFAIGCLAALLARNTRRD